MDRGPSDHSAPPLCLSLRRRVSYFWQVWVKIWKRDQTGHRKRSANEFGRKILDVIALGALEAQRTPTREGPGIRVVQVGREIVAREGKGCLTCFLSMQDVRPDGCAVVILGQNKRGAIETEKGKLWALPGDQSD